MRRSALSGLRARLFLVVVLVLVPLALLTLHTTFAQRRAAIRHVEQQTRDLARAVADDRRTRVFSRTQQFLRVMAALPEAGGRGGGDCSALFAELVRLDGRYVELGAANPAGDVFCSARGRAAGGNIAREAYFRTALADRGFAVGDARTGAGGAKDVLVLAHAVVGRDGRARSVVFAELDLSAVDLGPGTVVLPDGAFAVLLDRHARVLTRYPKTGARPGSVAASDAVLAALRTDGEGVLEAREDDGRHLFGFAPVRAANGVRYGHVVVGIPRGVAYAEVDRTTARNLIVLGLGSLLVLGLAWFGADLLILRGVRRLARTSRRVVAGDVDAETHLGGGDGELGQLAQTVAGLAAAMRSHERAVAEATAARRVTEEALRSEHAFVAAVIDIVGALVTVLDAEGRIVGFNRACEDVTGYAFAEVRGKPFWDVLIEPASAEPTKALFAKVRTRRAPTYRQGVLITRDGGRRMVAWASIGVFDPGDAVRFVVATGIDISDRKRAEDALRRSEAMARAFLESAAEAVVITDADGRIVVVNTQAERVFGYPREEMLGHPVERLLPERLRAQHERHRARYAADPRIVPIGSRLTLVGRRRDGSEFPLEISLSFIETDAGLRVMAFVVDITERVAMQQRARQTDKLAALGTLCAGIAHEVNNPIGIIGTRAELMLREPGITAPQAADVEVVLRQARRVGKIVNGLLAFARRSPGTRQPVDLNTVVEDTMVLVDESLRKSRVAVHLELDRDVPPVAGDPTGIQQVILNLLTNAREAMSDGGTLRIATAAGDDGRASVTVSDTGPGMPADVAAKIFDPFFTTKADGTGLGLAVSYGIVQEHDGTIDVHSQPGAGTTFVLTFPVAPHCVPVREPRAGRVVAARVSAASAPGSSTIGAG